MPGEVIFAEPATAVQKPLGLPKGMSPAPLAQPPSSSTPGAGNLAPKPSINPFEYGPKNVPPEYRSPHRVRTGPAGGYQGWNPSTETPIHRDIPRTNKQPAKYYDPTNNPWKKGPKSGRPMSPNHIRIPTRSPMPAPTPGFGGAVKAGAVGVSVYTFGKIVNAGGLSPGGLPDFSIPIPDIPDQPMPGDQKSICGKGCIKGSFFGLSSNGSLGVVNQFRVTEIAQNPIDGTGVAWEGQSWTADLGIYKVVAEGTLDLPGPYLFESRNVQAKETIFADDIEYVRYTYWVQVKGHIPHLKKKWYGKVGLLQGPLTPKSNDTGPNPHPSDASQYRWLRPYSTLDIYRECFAYFCDESGDNEYEPSPPDDYDRKDDGMACKWLTENNRDVDQLEIETFTFNKFKGCKYKANGDPDFFEEKEVRLPRGFGESFISMMNAQSETLSMFCELPTPVVPDWMPLKWANVEKLVVIYGEQIDGKIGPGKYQVTVPHWSLSKKNTNRSMFSSYTKGQYQCIFEMPDGSKITINANSPQTAKNLIEQFKQGLPNEYKQIETPEAGLRGGKTLKVIDVFPKEVRFYAAGTDELKPEWIKKFN